MAEQTKRLTDVELDALAGHTPGPWPLETVPTSVGSCHRIGHFPGTDLHPIGYACVYADRIRIGLDESTPRAQELAANARLIAASTALLAEVIERRARDADVAELVEKAEVIALAQWGGLSPAKVAALSDLRAALAALNSGTSTSREEAQ